MTLCHYLTPSILVAGMDLLRVGGIPVGAGVDTLRVESHGAENTKCGTSLFLSNYSLNVNRHPCWPSRIF